MKASAIRSMRRALGCTQQDFAHVLGFSFVSVNRWENRRAAPTGLSLLFLGLLEQALARSDRDCILAALRRCPNNAPEARVLVLQSLLVGPTPKEVAAHKDQAENTEIALVTARAANKR